MTKYLIALISSLVVVFVSVQTWADDKSAIEKLSVMGRKESLPTRPGSAHVLNEEDFKNYEINDIHRILRAVPGVNIQEEDGYGLRPNIGLRGAHPHRSKSITLMEDGVLIAPAPYAAPAAYYFPQMDKMASIEVFKGAPSTQFGPNSIGGAINMLTRINEPGLQLGTSQGSFGFQKYDLSLGVESFGDFSLDVTRMQSDGFKKLEGSDNTGFVRNNVTFRWDKYIVPYEQSITFKFNWSDEVSNETYTGLTREDFKSDPLRRYLATGLDRMDWNHRQLFANYALTPFKNTRFKTTAYHHEMERTWFKLNGFYGGGAIAPPRLDAVLRNPEFASNNYFFQVVRGDANSGVLSSNRDVLDLGNNDRNYISQGIQFQTDYELEGFRPTHLFSVKYRLHNDSVERNHDSTFYNMSNRTLVLNNNLAMLNTVENRSAAQARTTVLTYESQWEKLNYNAAIRYEDISYEENDRLTLTDTNSSDHIFAPGVGLYYQWFDQLGMLMGVNQGFTPVGPGQGPQIKPEEAINYEFGFRYTGFFAAELIGFYSDYKNILGTCTFSNGCDPNQVDTSFNGGAAHIAGAEFILNKELSTGPMVFPIRLSATYTEAYFRNAFESSLSEWGEGDIKVGDPIPYIPRWQGTLSLGLNWKSLFSSLSFNYQTKVADQAVELGREIINERVVTDFVLGYQYSPNTVFRFRVDNLTDERYVVSLRPMGLRPGLPQNFIVGISHAFR